MYYMISFIKVSLHDIIHEPGNRKAYFSAHSRQEIREYAMHLIIHPIWLVNLDLTILQFAKNYLLHGSQLNIYKKQFTFPHLAI